MDMTNERDKKEQEAAKKLLAELERQLREAEKLMEKATIKHKINEIKKSLRWKKIWLARNVVRIPMDIHASAAAGLPETILLSKRS